MCNFAALYDIGMKQRTKIVLFFTGIISLFLFSCQKFSEYPIEPQIRFEKFILLIDTIPDGDTVKAVSNRGILVFSYTDGDGDLGLRSADTNPPFNAGSPYYYNIIVKYYEKREGTFVQVPITNPDGETDTINFNGRFPYLTPNGIHKAIRGMINDTLPINNPDTAAGDTIKFKVFIYDRALHQSNEIETPEIKVFR